MGGQQPLTRVPGTAPGGTVGTPTSLIKAYQRLKTHTNSAHLGRVPEQVPPSIANRSRCISKGSQGQGPGPH